MKVYALIGESGTGKSYRALQIARERNIPAIIDDGLFILDGQYAAGYSGKYELTKMASVKRAIFLNEEHAREVRAAIEKNGIDRILILGISDRMVDRIAAALSLPPVSERLYIQEIASEKEIEIARKLRSAGNHAIPLPRIQVEEAGLGKWIRDVRSILTAEGRKRKQNPFEMTVVHPRFARGGIFIHERVIKAVVAHRIQTHPFVVKHVATEADMKMGLDVRVRLIVRHDPQIYERCTSLAEEIRQELRHLSGLPQIEIQIHVEDFA
jgi:hypothetical protein